MARALDEQIINRNRGHVSIVKLERVIFLFRKARRVCNRERERRILLLGMVAATKQKPAKLLFSVLRLANNYGGEK